MRMNKSGVDSLFAPAAVIGLAACLALQDAMFDYLYIPSADHAVSPLFVELLFAASAVAWSYASYRRDSTLLTESRAKTWFAVCTVAGALAAAMLATELVHAVWAFYVAAAVMGYTGASCIYLWATVYAGGVSGRHMLPTSFCALGLAAAAKWCLMHAGDAGSIAATPLFAAVTLVCFFACARGRVRFDAELLIRPRNMKSYVRVGVGLTLYALALGVTAGTTATSSTMDSMPSINADVALVGMIAAVVALLVSLASRERFTFLSAMQLFTPFVVAAMLLNVVAIQYADIWLAVTLFAWQLLRLISFGVLIEVARRGIASMALVFPLGWSALSGGGAIGVFIGQAVCPAFVEGEQAIVAVIVAVALVVVVAAMLVFGGGSMALFVNGSPAQGGIDRSALPLPTPSLGSAPLAEAHEEGDDPAPSAVPANGVRAADDAAAAPVASSSDETCVAADAGAVEAGGAAARKADADAAVAPEAAESAYDAACHSLAQTHHLTPREDEVARLLVRGHTRASIAKKLFVSENTVRAHVKNIYGKLSVHSKQQLIDLVENRAAQLEYAHLRK